MKNRGWRGLDRDVLSKASLGPEGAGNQTPSTGQGTSGRRGRRGRRSRGLPEVLTHPHQSGAATCCSCLPRAARTGFLSRSTPDGSTGTQSPSFHCVQTTLKRMDVHLQSLLCSGRKARRAWVSITSCTGPLVKETHWGLHSRLQEDLWAGWPGWSFLWHPQMALPTSPGVAFSSG